MSSSQQLVDIDLSNLMYNNKFTIQNTFYSVHAPILITRLVSLSLFRNINLQFCSRAAVAIIAEHPVLSYSFISENLYLTTV